MQWRMFSYHIYIYTYTYTYILSTDIWYYPSIFICSISVSQLAFKFIKRDSNANRWFVFQCVTWTTLSRLFDQNLIHTRRNKAAKMLISKSNPAAYSCTVQIFVLQCTYNQSRHGSSRMCGPTNVISIKYQCYPLQWLRRSINASQITGHRLFVLILFQVGNEEIIKAPHYWAQCAGTLLVSSGMHTEWGGE